MNKISTILAVMLLVGCSSMGTQGGGGMTGTSGDRGVWGMSGPASTNQMDINRHDSPSDTYFGD